MRFRFWLGRELIFEVVPTKKNDKADHHKIDIIVFDDTGEAALPLVSSISTKKKPSSS